MDFRMMEKTSIYNVDRQEEGFAKEAAKMDKFYGSSFAHEEKALNVSCKIGAAKAAKGVAFVMVTILGWPVGIYLGAFLALKTLSAWWAIIFP